MKKLFSLSIVVLSCGFLYSLPQVVRADSVTCNTYSCVSNPDDCSGNPSSFTCDCGSDTASCDGSGSSDHWQCLDQRGELNGGCPESEGCHCDPGGPSYPGYSYPSYPDYTYPSYSYPTYPDYTYPTYPDYTYPSYSYPTYPSYSYPTYPGYPTYPTYPGYPSYPSYSYPTYPSYSYPTYPGYPTYPTYPGYPTYPSYSYPTYPTYPSYSYPTYPTYGGPSYPTYPSYSYPTYPTYPSYSYPTYPGYPTYPSYPGYPTYPSYSYPTYPTYPTYPGYPTYPSYSYPTYPTYPVYPTYPSYPPPPPADPTNVQASNSVSCASIKITWTASVGSPAPTGYKVFWSSVANFASASNISGSSLGAAATSFTDASPGSAVNNYYWVVAYSGAIASGPVSANPSPIAIVSCNASLGGKSDKDITAINGSAISFTPCNSQTDPLPSNTALLKNGDTVTFQINLCNDALSGGGFTASNISLVDTLTNLQIPVGGWNAQYCNGASCVSVTPTLGGVAPNQTLTFDLSSASKNIPAGEIRNLIFKAQVAAPSAATLYGRFQNSAVISYNTGGAPPTANKTISTPFILLYNGSAIPTRGEMP
jgi:hypothetical protein